MSNLARTVTQPAAAVLDAPAAITANGNGTGFDLAGYEGSVLVTLAAGAVGGTNPTMAVKLQHSDTVGSGYTDLGVAFVTLTAAGIATAIVDTHGTKRYIRTDRTIGGTATPTFTLSANVVGVKKYH